MKKIWRRTLAYVMTVTMYFSAVNVPVYAKESNTTEVLAEMEGTKSRIDSSTWDQVTIEDVFESNDYKVLHLL